MEYNKSLKLFAERQILPKKKKRHRKKLGKSIVSKWLSTFASSTLTYRMISAMMWVTYSEPKLVFYDRHYKSFFIETGLNIQNMVYNQNPFLSMVSKKSGPLGQSGGCISIPLKYE